jgi:regulator of sigma E protease
MSVLIAFALEGERDITVNVKSRDDEPSVKIIKLSEHDTDNPEVLFHRLGFNPWIPKLKPIIGKVMPESAALAADLRQGDLIISADGVVMKDWMQWVDTVKIHPDVAINLLIERDGVRMPLVITPKSVTVEQKTEGKIGAAVYAPEDLLKSMSVEYSLSPLAALPVAVVTTYHYSVSTLKMMGNMLMGKSSVQNLSGPISIAQYAGQSANMGLVHFIKFMALVSVSLGVLNLLPVPVLDGGHLLFFAVEGVKGSPVSEKIQLFFQHIGIVLLVSLMALAMVLDIQRLFQ